MLKVKVKVVDDLILLLNEVTSEKNIIENLLPLASSQIAPLILSLYFS
jgi:hypothetical protein